MPTVQRIGSRLVRPLTGPWNVTNKCLKEKSGGGQSHSPAVPLNPPCNERSELGLGREV